MPCQTLDFMADAHTLDQVPALPEWQSEDVPVIDWMAHTSLFKEFVDTAGEPMAYEEENFSSEVIIPEPEIPLQEPEPASEPEEMEPNEEFKEVPPPPQPRKRAAKKNCKE